MKKLYLIITVFFASFGAQAQNDTLLWENFEGTLYYVQNIPNGVLGDTAWYNWDNDQNTDANGRPQDWWFYLPPADPDRYPSPGDTNYCWGSSSWHTPFAQADNWYVSPSIDIIDNQAVLRFKVASLQTPYFLDGLSVKISTNSNDLLDFTTTLFESAEYVSGASSLGADYGSYTFAPASGAWIQGWNGSSLVVAEIDTNVSTFTAPNTDSARFEGILTEHVINLGAYAGQSIYIAFNHDSDDDNQITIDDILITGTAVGMKEKAFNIGIKAYPNPATEYVELSFEMNKADDVTIEMYDVLGHLINKKNMGTLSGKQNYRLNVAGLAKGTYNVNVKTSSGAGNISFIKE
jgi:hypothetical protein